MVYSVWFVFKKLIETYFDLAKKVHASNIQPSFSRVVYSLVYWNRHSNSLCDVRGALLKYLFFNFRNIVQKCMYSSHNMRTKRHQKALFHYAKTSNLTENLIQDKTVKSYNKCKEIGLWPVGINKDQNKLFHRFSRDILNLYLNNSDDMSAFCN